MKSLFIKFMLITTAITFAQHEDFNTLLQQNVNNIGIVNYKSLQQNKSKLDTYIAYLEKTYPNNSWSKNQQKAFWINAYNAYTLKIILKHYPLKSILDIKYNGKGVWDYSFVNIGGKTYTLNHIEHEILRKKFNDPRIHVGVNCASYSCPALPNKAFTAKNIDGLLTAKMKSFINDKKRNKIMADKAGLSQIFNWFKDDFTKKGDLISYINQYSNVKINANTTINHLEYNWSLNGK